jgi:hypothetical protein
MKYNENLFDDYINSNTIFDLHKKINLKNIENIECLPNLIIYGPPGIGKYTQSLKIINQYSDFTLKYEKKISIIFNKTNYYYKISDIHYEIDMELLGCNSKTLWHEVFNHIIEIILSKNNKKGIILCKNFHLINSELLDIFYSYMQNNYNSNIILKFILICENICFLPDNIINNCKIINIGRPSKYSYNKCLKKKLPNNINNIVNIKDIKNDIELDLIYKEYSNKLLNIIYNYSNIDFMKLRENIYDIFIFNIDINICMKYVIKELIEKNIVKFDKISQLLKIIYDFHLYFNNNYRPIYHLEKYILNIISLIYEL